MTPEQIAGDTESSHQVAIFCWIALNKAQYPELGKLFAISNDAHSGAARGAMMVARGLRSGVPDMCLPVPRAGFHGAYFELKLEKYRGRKNGGCSDNQVTRLAELTDDGYYVKVVYGWIDAVEWMKYYINLGG